jgi:hypothetical protein
MMFPMEWSSLSGFDFDFIVLSQQIVDFTMRALSPHCSLHSFLEFTAYTFRDTRFSD